MSLRTSWPSWTSLIVDFGKDVHHLCLKASGREWHINVWSYAGNGNVDASWPFGEINNLWRYCKCNMSKLRSQSLKRIHFAMDYRRLFYTTQLHPITCAPGAFKDLCACIMSIKTSPPGNSLVDGASPRTRRWYPMVHKTKALLFAPNSFILCMKLLQKIIKRYKSRASFSKSECDQWELNEFLWCQLQSYSLLIVILSIAFYIPTFEPMKHIFGDQHCDSGFPGSCCTVPVTTGTLVM